MSFIHLKTIHHLISGVPGWSLAITTKPHEKIQYSCNVVRAFRICPMITPWHGCINSDPRSKIVWVRVEVLQVRSVSVDDKTV